MARPELVTREPTGAARAAPAVIGQAAAVRAEECEEAAADAADAAPGRLLGMSWLNVSEEERSMKTVITHTVVAGPIIMAGPARAQVTKTLTGETKVVTATVEAIEKS